jgi:hypothetical protein
MTDGCAYQTKTRAGDQAAGRAPETSAKSEARGAWPSSMALSCAGVEPAVRSEGFEPSLGAEAPIATVRRVALSFESSAHTASVQCANGLRVVEDPEMTKAAEVRDLGGFSA